mmetsp:Transcript_65446/g.168448  ORF Transcript_65446/g.168448 Transcript_65446/m.168448 type:complete len:223 (+) Transcript_65446:2-670(+)
MEKRFPFLKKINEGTYNTKFVEGINCSSERYDNNTYANLVAKFASLTGGAASVYTLPAMLSYPHCGTGHHELRRDVLFPHTDIIAKAAKQSNVDFHVIYLYRPIVDCLIADCVHRHWERCVPYTETLVANARHLTEQMARMEQGRIHCFKYGDVGSMTSAIDAAYGPSMHSSGTVSMTFRSKNSTTTLEDKYKTMAPMIGKQGVLQLQEAEAWLQQRCQARR